MRKIKVLHLTIDSKIAGTERLLLELGEKYDRNLFDMEFCTLSKRGVFHSEIERMGLKAYALDLIGKRDILMVYRRLYNLLKNKRFDIVHTHLFLSSFFGLWAAYFARVPVKVMTRHYSDYMYVFGNLLKVQVDRWSLRLTDRIIAVSNAVKKIIVERDKIKCSKVLTIHNGIDLDKFIEKDDQSEQLKHELGFRDFAVVGAAGSLELRKGHHFLIEAAPYIIKQVPRVKFIIAGDGPLLNSLKRQVKMAGLDEYVFFIGYRSDITRVISSFDVFVQPSVEEGFGIVVLEALAMGKPVVAFAVGGIREIISDSMCGQLVPFADTRKLSSAIVDFLTNKPDSERLKAEGRKIIFEHFNVKDMVRKYEQLYKELILNYPKNVTKIA